ncbi:unnamed protein product [Arctia plantaginis]|uniref:Uncharacterized protein n=1 Tax=Arctia plantaginis TaxID=874455 RepID=A0A8S0ZF06_ARCPL|nr:unnamed protein product [Arctia plantaginis]CAB3232204.1 unnamed protein product [Arctia plantaginis]
MDSAITSIKDFIRVRQINIALAGLLTLVYLLYQFWSTMVRSKRNGAVPLRLSRSPSRSRSNADCRSRHDHKNLDVKRRGRKSHRKCPDCSECNLEF